MDDLVCDSGVGLGLDGQWAWDNLLFPVVLCLCSGVPLELGFSHVLFAQDDLVQLSLEPLYRLQMRWDEKSSHLAGGSEVEMGLDRLWDADGPAESRENIHSERKFASRSEVEGVLDKLQDVDVPPDSRHIDLE